MGWFRRRRPDGTPIAAAPTWPPPFPAPAPELVGPTRQTALAPRTERAVVVLAVAVEQLCARLEHLDARVDALASSSARSATRHEGIADELADARRHTAKVAGQLARLDIELRGEVAAVAELVRASGRPSTGREAVPPRPKRTRRPPVVDLTVWAGAEPEARRPTAQEWATR